MKLKFHACILREVVGFTLLMIIITIIIWGAATYLNSRLCRTQSQILITPSNWLQSGSLICNSLYKRLIPAH